jgi:N utilization substance protein B
MLNRRIIRMKTLQYLYAVQQSKGANYLLSQDLIAELFTPDLTSMEPQDKVALEKDRKSSCELLDEVIGFTPKSGNVFDKKIHIATDRALQKYNELNRKDKEHLFKTLVWETESISDIYLQTLHLLHQIVKFIEQDAVDSDKAALRGNAEFKEIYLLQNPVLKVILSNKGLENEFVVKNINWDKDQEIAHGFYSFVRRDELVQAYLKKKGEVDFDAHKEIINHIIRILVFKDEVLQSYFEANDSNWQENKSVVKNMVSKTLKLITSDAPLNESLVVRLTTDWIEDKEFMKVLFHKTLENDKYFDEIITTKLKNWDLERLTTTDNLIIKMALAEMINFQAIPVKVSINEYIEVAKNYSTPKSKQFVNGVLDKLSADLVEQGVIKKSGKGLI